MYVVDCINAQQTNRRVKGAAVIGNETSLNTQLGSPSFTSRVPFPLSESFPDPSPNDSLASLFSLKIALSLSWISSFLCSIASRAEFKESSCRSKAEYSEIKSTEKLLLRTMVRNLGDLGSGRCQTPASGWGETFYMKSNDLSWVVYVY